MDLGLKRLGWIAILILGLNCQREVNQFSLSGKWREIKTESVYETNKLENIVEFTNVNEIFSGKIIGLDDPLTNQKKIRVCGYCEVKENPMLLGYNIIKDLRFRDDAFIGKIYDVYNRKWFDVKIDFINENTINVRIFAVLQIFGRNIKWKRSEDFFHEVVKKDSVDLELDTTNIYAVNSHNIEKINGREIYFNFIENTQKPKKIYTYQKNGNLISELKFVKTDGFLQLYSNHREWNDGEELVYFVKKK